MDRENTQIQLDPLLTGSNGSPRLPSSGLGDSENGKPFKPRISRNYSSEPSHPSKDSLSASMAAGPREILIYLILAAYIMFLMIRCTWNLSKEEGLNYEMYKWRLDKGYLFGRHMDNSDQQYAGFRKNVSSLVWVLLGHMLVSHGFTYFARHYWQSFERDSLRSLIRKSPSVPIKLWSSLPFSLVILTALYGASILKIVFFYGLAFYFIKKLGSSPFAPIILWTYCIVILFLNHLYDGYKFGDMLSFLGWMDSLKGLGMKWEASFNFGILKMISFGMDYHWRLQGGVLSGEKHRLNCYECRDGSNPCSKARIEEGRSIDQYSLFNYFSYCLYIPLYLAGPIITFNDFLSQAEKPPKSITTQSLTKYALRWIGCYFLMEVIMHAFHIIAISKDRAWPGFTPFQIMMVGYFTLVHIWLKLLIIWRFFRFWAMLDGIETVENMTRCVTDQFSPAEFWRTWHRSYNRWIIRYLYVPLGGSKTMMYNVWVIFTFVAVWHDIKLQLLAWGWMIALFIIPEAICTKIFCTDKWRRRLGVYHRHLTVFGATLNILTMMMANLIGYSIGVDGMLDFIKQMATRKGITFFFYMMSSLFIATQLNFAYREYERRSDAKEAKKGRQVD